MNLAQKIAQTPKLERIDSSIESCIKILEQELVKRVTETQDWDSHEWQMHTLLIFKDGFNIMKTLKNIKKDTHEK